MMKISISWHLLTSEHSTALGAHKAPYGHVEIGWTSLITIKTFLVSRVAGLNVSDGNTELVILLHLSDVGDLGHDDLLLLIS